MSRSASAIEGTCGPKSNSTVTMTACATSIAGRFVWALPAAGGATDFSPADLKREAAQVTRTPIAIALNTAGQGNCRLILRGLPMLPGFDTKTRAAGQKLISLRIGSAFLSGLTNARLSRCG